MKTKICCFAGHAELYNKEEIKPKLKKEIINLIENHGVTEFYSGGKGEFDWFCAHCVDELKSEYPFIKSYLLLAYMPKEKEQNDPAHELFDGTVYPDIEKTPPRFAILKRNEWMVNKSDFLIAYVKNNFGGATKTLEYAKRKSHIVIKNLGSHDILDFPARLRLLKIEKGLTQAELAKEIGIVTSTIGMYEQGRREPDFNTFLKICCSLNTNADYILGLMERSRNNDTDVQNIFYELIEKLEKNNKLTFKEKTLNQNNREKIIVAMAVALEVSERFIIKKSYS